MEKVYKNFIKTIPVMTGYLVLGIAFGILLRSHGYGLGWALLMSVCIYAGSMQFVAINLMSAGAGVITTALTTFMVNARHIFYGISMLTKYKNIGKAKPYLIFSLSDETYSLVVSQKDATSLDYLIISLFDQCYWVIGSVIGSVAGALIPWDFKGIDFALTALFVCIVTQQWMEQRDHLPAIVGMGSTLICLICFGKDNFLIPSMILISVVINLLSIFKKEKKDD